MDVEEWVAWCKENNKALDGSARSEFTAQKTPEMVSNASTPSQFVSRKIKSRSNPTPFLDTLEAMFEKERKQSITPPFPFDKEQNIIRLPPEVERHLQKLVRSGNKKEAMEQVTKLTGAGLRLAKDYVDGLER